MSDKEYKPLRGFNVPSYDPMTGMPASGLGVGQSFTVDGRKINPSSQVSAASPPGSNGAPGPKWLDQNRTQGGRSKFETDTEKDARRKRPSGAERG
jgi:hypothetical protein